ncbi:MAG: 2-oxoacid:ferredoxin oxidoreductase subunit gamma, partial [Caldilineae bacterium]
METSIVIAGFGGQGVLFAGQLLAYAALEADKHVTWIPSYGPEMRGGTANCTVIIADEPIGSPYAPNPDAVIAMNLPSTEKYLPLVRPGGLLLYNSSLVEPPEARPDIQMVPVPATELARAHGNERLANVVMLGALLALQPVLPVEAVERALE